MTVELQTEMGVILFRGVGDGVTDDSTALQSAIDQAASFGGNAAGQVLIRPGTYVIDNITLKSRVDLIGTDQRACVFTSKPGSTNAMFNLDAGPVFNCRYENFICLGTGGGAGQHCFHLQAQASTSSPFNGGLWWSTFRNVTISRFSGYAMWFRGGPSGFLRPHQFISLQRVTILRGTNDTYSRSALLTGQCGQFTFDSECQIDGNTSSGFVGVNIELGPEYINAGVVGGQLVGGTPNGGTNTPYNIKFMGTTSQNAETAIYAYNSINVKAEGCYFENINRCLRGVGASNNFIADTCHFTNAASDGAQGGYCFQLGVSSTGVFAGNDVAGAVDRVISNSSAYLGLHQAGNTVISTPLATTKVLNYTIQKAQSGGTITTDYLRSVGITGTAGTISTITSKLIAGDQILFEDNIATGNLVFDNAGNVRLGHWTSLALSRYDTALFEYSDLFEKWLLLSTTGILS